MERDSSVNCVLIKKTFCFHFRPIQPPVLSATLSIISKFIDEFKHVHKPFYFFRNCYFRRNRLCPRCNRIKGKFAQQQQQQLIEQTDHSNTETQN